MKRLVLLSFVLFIVASIACGANLTVNGTSTYVVTSNATYDLVIIEDQASLVVTNGATLTAIGCIVGYDDSSFLFDNCTVVGRMNIESSNKFHCLNATLTNIEGAPTNSIINSENIIISSSSISATGPAAGYYSAGGEANIELVSENTIQLRNADLSCQAGAGTWGYWGPQPDGRGTILIESDERVYIENSSDISVSGYSADVTISCDFTYVTDSSIYTYGQDGASGNIEIISDDVNVRNSYLYAEGGDGMPGSIHGYAIYAWPTNGGNGNIELTGDVVNLANNTFYAEGGNGGSAPYNVFGITDASGGSAYVTIISNENTSPSLYNNSYSLSYGTGSSNGTTATTITPSSINGAGSSTVEIPRIVLDDFEDQDIWSPASTMGWWDSDGITVYQHTLIDYFVSQSIKTMCTTYNKSGYAWSLFSGYQSAGNPHRDFSDYNTVRVWCSGTDDVLVKLRDGSYAEEDIATQSMSTSSDVSPVDFNYSSLSSVDLSNIDNVMFFVAPGNSTATGTCYIDSVELINTLELDDFESKSLANSTTKMGWSGYDGSSAFIFPTKEVTAKIEPLPRYQIEPSFRQEFLRISNVYILSLSTSVKHEETRALKIDFAKSGYPNAYVQAYLATSNTKKNFSEYRKLGFWIYGGTSVMVKLRDRTGSLEDMGTISGVAAQWTYISLDITEMTIDASDIHSVRFYVAPGSVRSSGTIYLDDIKLSK